MTFARLFVSGIEYTDVKSIKVDKSISDSYFSSNFNADLDSPFGRHNNDFNVGNEVIIYASGTDVIGSLIFTGILETLGFEGEENSQIVRLSGKDYTTRLIDYTVEPSVYTNVEVGSIVRDIITNYTVNIGSSNIQNTNTTLKRISFNHTPVFDAIKQLADLSLYQFYVDNNKDLNFRPRLSGNIVASFHSGNLIKVGFDKTREGMANRVWVYGDRYLTSAPGELFILGATPGSVYTLAYRPHNTSVRTSNINPGSNLKGGIFEVVGAFTSGADYLVSFFDRQIIFISGTSIGYSTLPNANGSVLVNYERDLPIVKFGENRNSINAFGGKTRVINDKSIKDPNTAVAILKRELDKSDPFNNIELEVDGWFNINPGEIVNVNINDFNLSESGLPIIDIRYNFNKDTVFSDNVISLRLDKREIDITDKIRELSKRLESLESQDRQDSDVITRLESTNGSMLIIGSRWRIQSKWNGSEFRVWGSDNFPPLGSNFTPRLGLLVSGNIGHASWIGSVSYLASGTFSYGPFIQRSGGYSGY